jgi:hypothetical protein
MHGPLTSTWALLGLTGWRIRYESLKELGTAPGLQVQVTVQDPFKIGRLYLNVKKQFKQAENDSCPLSIPERLITNVKLRTLATLDNSCRRTWNIKQRYPKAFGELSSSQRIQTSPPAGGYLVARNYSLTPPPQIQSKFVHPPLQFVLVALVLSQGSWPSTALVQHCSIQLPDGSVLYLPTKPRESTIPPLPAAANMMMLSPAAKNAQDSTFPSPETRFLPHAQPSPVSPKTTVMMTLTHFT